VNRLRARIGPLWPYVVLTLVPAAAFILPDLFGGHLLMAGDNAQQNYPLHVLAGSMLSHGQLPLWNPYIFSGTPLLADFNAGAFYPLVGLFVILPDRVAWIATEVILFSLIAVGMYVYLRAVKRSTIASVVAAGTFAFSGVVLSQVNHVDMTEGFVAIPFLLLAVLHIVRDGRWRWSVVLGISFALVILGGAPEAMLDEAILTIAYAAFSAGFDRARWWRVLTRGGAGAGLALALAAVQWLPGLNVIANSQRAGLGSSFAATGSYPPFDLLTGFVPYLWGGYGYLHEVSYFATYNLPEVGIYVGILPVIALLTLWHPRWPSKMPARDRLTWYCVGTIGLLLALGQYTPLEHLFNSIPLYGGQRLQSRNMITVSTALCVLFAGWIDRRVDTEKSMVWFDRATALIPLAVVGALAGLAFFDPQWLIPALSGHPPTPRAIHATREASSIALAFCLTAGVVVWLRTRLALRYWVAAVAVFVVVDIGWIAGTSQLVKTPPNAVLSGTAPVERYVSAHLAPGGRFDLYDPQGYTTGSAGANAVPDYNILAGLPSVGGYGSIVNATYNSLTETHSAADLDIASLGAGKLNDLSLQDILTAPDYFLLPVSGALSDPGSLQPVSERVGQDPVFALGFQSHFAENAYPPYPGPRGELRAGQESTWFLGETLDPNRASVLLTGDTSHGAEIRFGKIGAHGVTRWGPTVRTPGGALSVTGPLPGGDAVGLAVQVVSGRLPPHQAVVWVARRPYELDGSLSLAIQPGLWRQQGSVEDLTLFVRTRPPMTLHALGATPGPAPTFEILADSANTETVRVRTAGPITVVRQVAWDSGWHASVSADGGPAVSVPVGRHGLVQQVRVPAGTDVVRFGYSPHHWLVASLLSEGSSLFLAVLLVGTLIRWRRRRRGDPVTPSPSAGSAAQQ
jgi:hypothetical protein